MFKSKMKHNVKNKEERKTKKRNKSKSIREKRYTREGAEVLDGYCVVQVHLNHSPVTSYCPLFDFLQRPLPCVDSC